MSTSIALSASAQSQSTAALIMARSAECRAIEAGFNPNTATVEEKQEYASCISDLYPTSSESKVLAGSFLLVIALIVVGAIIGYKEDGGEGIIIGGGLGLGAACVIGLIVGIICAVLTLFS